LSSFGADQLMSAPEDDDDDMMEDEEGEEEEPKASDEATFDIWNLSESTRLHTCCFWLTSPFRDP
jgi:hypothetical protein